MAMKNDLLPFMQEHSFQLVYDTTEDILIKDVLDDIEKFDFDNLRENIKLLRKWRFRQLYWLIHLKNNSLSQEDDQHRNLYQNLPELFISGESSRICDEVFSEVS
jgi:hypothetical protein